MKLSQVDVDRLSKQQITKILFSDEQANNQESDCIFVYGGRGIERVEKAVNLYKQKKANHILFSGGLKYGKYIYPEAATMKDKAVEMGVPATAILTEELSNNTKENAISSLFTLENKFGIHTIKNLLVVSIPWHYRRSLLSLKTYYPQWIDYIWCPANYQEHQPDNWWQYPQSEQYVMAEITKIVRFVQEGQLIDIEIEI